MSTKPEALYACGTGGWQLVARSLSAAGFHARVSKPMSVADLGLKPLIEFPGTPPSLKAALARRDDDKASDLHLGLAELLLPAFIHSGISIPDRLRRLSYSQQSSRVASQINSGANLRLFQFTDGLGHKFLSDVRTSETLSICERRSLHPKAFTVPHAPIGGIPYEPLFEDPIKSILEIEFEQSDRIIVYSRYAARTFVEAGVAASKLVVLPVPMPQKYSDLNGASSRRITTLFVGRCTVSKGLDVAVEATRLAGTQLEVAGPATSDVLSWMRRQQHVTYHGILPKTKMLELMRSARLLLLPSNESFGLVVGEAVSQGCMPLVSQTVGVADWLPLSELDLIAPSRHADAWAKRIAELLAAGEEELNQIMNLIQRRADDFTTDHCINYYGRFYRELGLSD